MPRRVISDTAPFCVFSWNEEALSACVTPTQHKALVITSPNNPTGCVLAAARLSLDRWFANVCPHPRHLRGSATTYTTVWFIELGYERLAAREDKDLREQVVVVESFSKPWAMTGWRMGWSPPAIP